MKKQIDHKIKNKQYVFENTECPICHTSKTEKIGEKDRYGLYFSTVLCKECGLVYTNPRMNQPSYNEFYNTEYRKLYVGEEKANQLFFDNQYKKGKLIYDFIAQQELISKKKFFVLEVGTGAGGILQYFKEKGHQVKGIDLGEEYIDYGNKKKGLDLSVDTLASLSLTEKPDVIIYSHILEHILDLNTEIELIKKWSKPNSLIYIEVPGIKEIHLNYEMNILKYFQNVHTFHFTLESLCNIMASNSFTEISLLKLFLNKTQIPLLITVLTMKSLEIISSKQRKTDGNTLFLVMV